MNNLGTLLPSGQNLYMQNLVDGGSDELIPPTMTEVKEWKMFYPMYFNIDYSHGEGRRLPKNLCLKNPTIHEIYDGLKALGFRVMIEMVRMIPIN